LGPRLGAVRAPELGPGRAVVGREEQGPSDVQQVARVRADLAREYVLDELRPRLGPVRAPELRAVRAVVGREEEDPADAEEGDGVRVPAGVDVLDEARSRLGLG